MQGSARISERSQEEGRERDKILYLIDKLRSITLAVQIAPFVYTFLYIIAISLYFFVSDGTAVLLDTFLYVSPLITILFLVESRILKLCKWHRTACVIPIMAHFPVIIDTYLYELSTDWVYVTLSTILLMSALLLVAAYNVFFR